MKTVLLALALLVLAACSSSSAPHSEYYVVFFDPAGATLLPEGQAALATAVRDAARGKPDAVEVKGYLSADGNAHDLSEARMQVVEQALVHGGVAQSLVKLAPETTDPTTFAQLGTGVVVQVERGDIPPPAKPDGEGTAKAAGGDTAEQ